MDDHRWDCPCSECEQTRSAGLEYFDEEFVTETLTGSGWKVGDDGSVLGHRVLAYFNADRSPKDFISVRSDGRVEVVIGGEVMVITKDHERLQEVV